MRRLAVTVAAGALIGCPGEPPAKQAPSGTPEAPAEEEPPPSPEARPHPGHAVYIARECGRCHDRPDGHAPVLEGWGTVPRLVAFLKNPDAPHFFGGTRLEGLMEPVMMPEGRLERLAAWLLDPEHPQGLAYRDWTKAGCEQCHNDPRPDAQVHDPEPTGPDLRGYQTEAWTRAILLDPQGHLRFGPATSDSPEPMTSRADLPRAELDALVAWLMAGAPAGKGDLQSPTSTQDRAHHPKSPEGD